MESIEAFNSALTKAEFKDKLARLFQYGCRGVIGLLVENGLGAKETLEMLRLIQGSLGDARRVNRFFKELSIAPSIPKDLEEVDEANRWLTIGNKIALIGFFVTDHIAMLQKWKIVNRSVQPSDTIKTAMTFFTIAQFAGLLLQLKKLKEEAELEGTPKFSKVRRDAAGLAAVKAALLVFQGLHVSGIAESRDSLVGAAGIFTSLLDLQSMWPIKSIKRD